MINKKAYRLPAEWEPQSGIMLTWPHANTDWAPMRDEIIAVYYEMAREIAQRQGVDGIRWMKMTDPSGGEAPSNVGSFLIWQ